MIQVSPSIRAFWDRLTLKHQASPPAAAAGYGRLYMGSDGELYLLKGDTTVVQLTDSGSVAIEWGAIAGTLGDQTDLQSALDGKAASSHTHGAGDVVSGQLAVARGGTGLGSTPTNGQVLIGNGTGFALAVPTAQGLTVSGGAGTLALATARLGPITDGQVPSGRNFSSPFLATATGTGIATVDRAYCWPFYLQPGHGFNRVVMRIQTTEASRTARVGVIGVNTDGTPNRSVIHADGGVLDLSTGSEKTATVDLSGVSGWVYLVCVFDSTLTTGSMYRGLMVYSGLGEGTNNGAGGLYLTASSSGVGTSLAASLSSDTVNTESSAMPWMGLKRA